MKKAINEDVCIIGSDLIVAIKIPPVDGVHTLKSLIKSNRVVILYYIINTSLKYNVNTYNLYLVLGSTDPDYNNTYAFNVNTSNLKEGVLMVEIKALIPDSRFNGTRTEIARCSTGIAIIK